MSDEVLDQQVETGEGQEGQQEGGEQSGQQHFKDFDGKPFETWNAIYGKYKTASEQAKQWTEFGDPNSVRSRLQKLQEWEKQVEQYQRQQQDKSGQLAPDKQKIVDELYNLLPWMKDAQNHLKKIPDFESKFGELEHSLSQKEASAHAERASSEFTGMLTKDKFDTKRQERIEKIVWHEASEEAQQKAMQGDYSGMFETYKQLRDAGELAGFKAAPMPPNPPRRNTPGGTPPKGPGAKPTDWNKATDEAWDAFRESHGA